MPGQLCCLRTRTAAGAKQHQIVLSPSGFRQELETSPAFGYVWIQYGGQGRHGMPVSGTYWQPRYDAPSPCKTPLPGKAAAESARRGGCADRVSSA